MRRIGFVLLLLLAVTGPAPGSTAGPAPGGWMTANVSWVAGIPIEAPGIGARVIRVGAQTRFYITGAKGLSIYDVTNPELPVPLAVLPLPHLENESVAVADDGSLVVIASDSQLDAVPLFYVIDTSNVRVPLLKSAFQPGSHTSTCADPACDYLYASNGMTFDLRNRAAPVQVTPGWGAYTGVYSGHYLNRDASGLITVERGGRAVIDPRQDPTQPEVLVQGTTTVNGIAHNSLRPNAGTWSAATSAPGVKPGELLIGGGETWPGGPTCDSDSAGVTTWNMAGFENGTPMQLIDTYAPRNGVYIDGYAPAKVNGCSSHWFDYRAGILAAGWYEDGTHLLRIDEQTGDIAEVGFYQPFNGVTWGAWWVDDTHVYVVDAARGVDILRFDRNAPAVRASEWPQRPIAFSPVAERERWLCRTLG